MADLVAGPALRFGVQVAAQLQTLEQRKRRRFGLLAQDDRCGCYPAALVCVCTSCVHTRDHLVRVFWARFARVAVAPSMTCHTHLSAARGHPIRPLRLSPCRMLGARITSAWLDDSHCLLVRRMQAERKPPSP